MVHIYILQLEQGKYYVGKTNNPDFRLEQHLNVYGSAWTHKYKPIKVIKLINNCDDFDEDKWTVKYMEKYGIDNVRGGSFCTIILNNESKNTIKRMIKGATNKCYPCGRDDHFINGCDAVYHIDGHRIEKKISKKNNRLLELKNYNGDICYKCGRKGHLVINCYARRHIDGSSFDLNTCYACGRKGHWKITCKYKTDVYGRNQTDPLCMIM